MVRWIGFDIVVNQPKRSVTWMLDGKGPVNNRNVGKKPKSLLKRGGTYEDERRERIAKQ